MNFIQLDRPQPFASSMNTVARSVSPPISTPTNTPATSKFPQQTAQQPLTPAQTPSPVQASLRYTQDQLGQTQLQFEPHTNVLAALPPVEINMNQLRIALETASLESFKNLCTDIVPPVPLIDDVISIFANAFEVVEFQQAVEQSPHIIDNLTIAEVLNSYSEPKKISKSFMNSKLLFLQRLLKKSQRMAADFDWAVLCHSKDSEEHLYFMLSDVLDYFGEGQNIIPPEFYPVTGRTKISSFAPDSSLYGIIFKHRKHTKDMSLTFKPFMDLILIYDSACRVNQDKIFNVFQGTRTSRPPINYLSIADSADFRIHYFNSLKPLNRIDWNTKVSKLSSSLRNSLLFQPNRAIHQIADVCGWIDAASQSLINWVREKSKSPFIFKVPRKGRMGELYNEFIHRSSEHSVPRTSVDNGTVVPPPSPPATPKTITISALKRKVSAQATELPAKKARPSPKKNQDRIVTFDKGTKKPTASSTIITKTIHRNPLAQASSSSSAANHIANINRSRSQLPKVKVEMNRNEYTPHLPASNPHPSANGHVLKPISKPYSVCNTPIVPGSSSSGNSNTLASSRGLLSTDSGIVNAIGPSMRVFNDHVGFALTPTAPSNTIHHTTVNNGSTSGDNLLSTLNRNQASNSKTISSSVRNSSNRTASFADDVNRKIDDLFSEALKQFEMDMDALNYTF